MDLLDSDAEPEKKTNILKPLLVAAVALIALFAFLWWTSLANFFRYRETPVQEFPAQEPQLAEKTILLPLNVIVFRNEGELGSKRTLENVTQLLTNAEHIFAQARITFHILAIQETEKTEEELAVLLDDPAVFMRGVPKMRLAKINIFLLRKLRGINGIAFTGLNAVAVADLTTVDDFRALAHEIGHMLGLEHTNDSPERLMYKGAQGITLTDQEIKDARAKARLWTQ